MKLELGKRITIVMATLALVGVTAAVAGRPREAPKGQTTSTHRRGSTVGEAREDPSRSHAQAVARQAEKSRTYRGTVIKPLPDSAGVPLALQQEIAAAFARLDPQPADRLEHFSWLEDLEGPRLSTRVVEWRGLIQDIAPIPGGLRIKVRIVPELGSERGVASTNDYSEEVYDYTSGSLRYIGEVPEPRTAPRVVTYQ